MQADFERFKELKTTEEKEAFKKEMQDKYNKLPEAQKEAYKKASEAGLKATVNACNDYIERAEEAILRDKLGELPEAISYVLDVFKKNGGISLKIKMTIMNYFPFLRKFWNRINI